MSQRGRPGKITSKISKMNLCPVYYMPPLRSAGREKFSNEPPGQESEEGIPSPAALRAKSGKFPILKQLDSEFRMDKIVMVPKNPTKGE